MKILTMIRCTVRTALSLTIPQCSNKGKDNAGQIMYRHAQWHEHGLELVFVKQMRTHRPHQVFS